MTRRKLSLFLILAMGVVTALGVYLIQAVEEPRPPETTPPPVPVEVASISARDFTHRLEALGTVEAIREAAVGAEITGPVSRIPSEIELGAGVKQGEILAEIDPTPFRIDVSYRKALVARAQARVRSSQVNIARQQALIPINREKLRLARAEHDRLADLLKRDLIAEQEAERAELALRRIEEELERAESGLREAEVEHAMAEAELASARAELARASKALTDTRVRAPFPGIISEKQVTLGEQVERGKVLFRLADITVVKLLVRVPPEDIALLRPGIVADVTVSGLTARFQGRVAHIGPRADDQTRSFPVEILIANLGPRRLLPGMFARASIPVHTYPQAVLVPRSSVLMDSGPPTVFVADAEKGIAHRRPVALGRSFGSRYLIERGLRAGDFLVIAGHHLLRDGAAIRIVGTREP